MKRYLLFGIVTLLGLVVIVSAGAIAYVFLGSSAPVSAPISAPTLAAASSSPSGTQLFQIVPDQSEVRFQMSEILRGQPNTVIGRSNQVAGSVLIDPTTPANSQVGTVRVDARTLVTDSAMRNRVIGSAILQTAQYEYIEFKPTALTGLPQSVALNQPFTFKITGDLTIRTVTHPVTFDVTVTPVSATQVKGTAAATIQRADYNLVIPSVPSVANVSEAVQLQIDFVATAAGGSAGAAAGASQ
jgi:polyisoprenoid-binding protein YceI